MNNNLFGTDGIRNRVGCEPFTITQLPRLGAAIALWAHKKYNPDSTHTESDYTRILSCANKPIIGLIASDTRISSSFIKAALTSGILPYQVTLVDAGIIPTPALFALLKNQNTYQFGIMITASHNPYHDNGIKLIDAQNGKLSEIDEQTITTLFHTFLQADIPQLTFLHTDLSQNASCHADIPQPDYTLCSALTTDTTLAQQYHDHIVQQFGPDFLKNITVVLDCAHGATSHIAPALFTHLGAQVITINNSPDGSNINKNCGALHPEYLKQIVLQHKADMGFAFDGDGDRVTVVNQHGDIKDGDDIIALLATHPRYAHQHTIVGTIMSNKGLEVHLQSQNKQLVRTPVGDKHISAYIKQHDLLLGGEQSGHIIMHDYISGGDGIFTALRILETVLVTGNKNLCTFTKYHQTLINIPVLIKKNLSQQPYADTISNYAQQLPNDRLEVRYSGTENVLRIMVESLDHAHALSIGNQLAHDLQKQLSTE